MLGNSFSPPNFFHMFRSTILSIVSFVITAIHIFLFFFSAGLTNKTPTKDAGSIDRFCDKKQFQGSPNESPGPKIKLLMCR